MQERFWAKVEKSDGCWEWRGCVRRNGYGQFKFDGRIQPAHRVAWQVCCGRIHAGLFVLHRCDNRLCVRPSHLALGTHRDNMRDMVAKGRQACGERIGIAKLTISDVLEIRARHAAGAVSMTRLAREFGVKNRAIRWVVRRRTWRHVA